MNPRLNAIAKLFDLRGKIENAAKEMLETEANFESVIVSSEIIPLGKSHYVQVDLDPGNGMAELAEREVPFGKDPKDAEVTRYEGTLTFYVTTSRNQNEVEESNETYRFHTRLESLIRACMTRDMRFMGNDGAYDPEGIIITDIVPQATDKITDDERHLDTTVLPFMIQYGIDLALWPEASTPTP